jgi:hypothetical protein
MPGGSQCRQGQRECQRAPACARPDGVERELGDFHRRPVRIADVFDDDVEDSGPCAPASGSK